MINQSNNIFLYPKDPQNKVVYSRWKLVSLSLVVLRSRLVSVFPPDSYSIAVTKGIIQSSGSRLSCRYFHVELKERGKRASSGQGASFI